jgi:hypothetical protein
MRGLVILVAAATIHSGAHHPVADGKIRLAQAVTTPPTVTAPPTRPSTPVTSTVTNCMMSCNSQAANCHAGCFVPAPGLATPSPAGTVILNSTANTACSLGCSSTQLACHTNCARLSPSR